MKTISDINKEAFFKCAKLMIEKYQQLIILIERHFSFYTFRIVDNHDFNCIDDFNIMVIGENRMSEVIDEIQKKFICVKFYLKKNDITIEKMMVIK